MTITAQHDRSARSYHHGHALAGILGPAFVAAVAYVDPGNVAANITSGARYGYLLVWVLVLANCMSVLIQYQSAKLGIVTGKSLPEILGERLGDAGRFMFFMQAEVIAIATDLAEVIGGAISLKLLFGLPLFVGGCIIGAVSTVLLIFEKGATHRIFEKLIIGLLLVAAMVSRHGALASTSVVVVDALISIPTVLIALMLSVPFGASAAVIIAACGLAYGLNLARILRPAAMLAARSDYVESALWSGASSLRVFFTHIVPNTVPVLCVQLSMSAGTSLLAEAGLTYLGVGVGAGVPSWGHSLATSVKFISIYPMAVVWPGLVVTLMVIALNLFGDALRDAIDPLTNPALRQGEATHVESEERA